MNKTLSDLLGLSNGPVSEEQKKTVLKKYNYKCHYCGKELTYNSAHIDHATPISKGGLTITSNLRASCSQCNLSKGDKTEAEFFELRKSAALELLGSMIGK